LTDAFKKVLDAIFSEASGRDFRFMEFCGGHTYALAKSGMASVLPDNIKMVHGPGCPVCVLPTAKVALGMQVLRHKDVILCTYGDVMRVPDGKGGSFAKMKAQGADVRTVYSPLDALKIAKENQDKKVVFFAVGFETTAPLTAAVVMEAKRQKIKNFFVLNNHIVTEKAMRAVLAESELCGVIAPGHVAAITGFAFLEKVATDFKMPMVVTGFEPMDLLVAILMLVRQVNGGSYRLENEYKRALKPEGNPVAMALLNQVFAKRKDFNWRGLGTIPDSAFSFAEEYEDFDAEKVFSLCEKEGAEPKGCICPLVIKGEKEPTDCPLFARACVPENPVGACMVSSEGTCGAYYKYNRGKL